MRVVVVVVVEVAFGATVAEMIWCVAFVTSFYDATKYGKTAIKQNKISSLIGWPRTVKSLIRQEDTCFQTTKKSLVQ
ncbi:MAG TPA: hypothetical protein VFT06_16185, partial [Flavisolibacter sp.]|nr:hypothetical protein [Flavisolibacter sp.]